MHQDHHDPSIVKPWQRRRSRPRQAFDDAALIINTLNDTRLVADSRGFICLECSERIDKLTRHDAMVHRHGR